MFGLKKRIYLDYASAPPVLPEAARAAARAERLYGNPGAIHAEGVAAKKALEEARARIAKILECKARELVFTGGLTEANNLAILGTAKRLERAGGSLSGTHWVVSAIEHDSILECFAEVEARGGTVSHIEPDERGLILPEALERTLRPETVFVSIGWANNEIGTVQPLARLARVVRAYEKKHGSRVLFHADAGQAPLYLSTVVHSLGVNLIGFGANKLYGPHGIGALWTGKGVEPAPVIAGGKQERGLRAGTESVALAAGFAEAFSIVARERDAESERLRALRNAFAGSLQEAVPGLVVNGDLKHALPHMLNVSVPDIQSEYVTLALDAKGVAVSTKSACREGEESRSHVVAALPAGRQGSGGDLSAGGWRASNTLRFSLGRATRAADLRRAAEALAESVRSAK